MKYLFSLLLTAVLSFSAVSSVAKSTTPDESQRDMQTYAQDLGITVKQWQYAVAQYEGIVNGDIETELLSLNEYPDYYNAIDALENGDDKEFIRILNSSQAAFASELGLPVDKLLSFLSYYERLKLELKFKELNQGITMSLDDVERITVVCDLRCQSQDALRQYLNITWLAKAANVPNRTHFVVVFTDVNGGTTNPRALYTYNTFSGAVKVMDLPPCDPHVSC